MNNRRNFYRHPYHYPIKICEEKSVVTQTVDVSLGGLCIDYEKNFLPGQMVTIEIPLNDHVFKLTGEVCYSVKKGNPERFRVGIAFKDKASQFMAKMAEEILCIQKLQKRMSEEANKQVDETIVADAWIKKNAERFAHYFE
ncbi:MAG TPA: PilZ domain-containing protein [Candidatus Omnitrophota bacterium]|nr:PilZ domain-containing protein [Candidatus Omnitrophota bacterium]